MPGDHFVLQPQQDCEPTHDNLPNQESERAGSYKFKRTRHRCVEHHAYVEINRSDRDGAGEHAVNEFKIHLRMIVRDNLPKAQRPIGA